MKEITAVKKKKKRKSSILDPFAEDIRYYVNLGITVPNITKLMNEKTPVRLSITAYRHFIETRLK